MATSSTSRRVRQQSTGIKPGSAKHAAGAKGVNGWPAGSAEAILAAAGLRRTTVRVGVLELLSHATESIDVPQILAKLPPHTDAVTVYRTLNTFTRKKLVHRIRGEDRSWRYALGSSHESNRHRHPHFVCEECGKVECLTDAQIPPTLIRSLGVGRDYRVRYPEVVLHGQCPRCR